MIRAVLDTNILVSALITPKGQAAAILQLSDHFTLCLSWDILAELRDVLGRNRIRRRYPLTDDDVDRYISILRQDALVVSPMDHLAGTSRDPDDDMFFACALSENADCIVSRDPHVLEVQGFTVSILTPQLFLEWLRRSR